MSDRDRFVRLESWNNGILHPYRSAYPTIRDMARIIIDILELGYNLGKILSHLLVERTTMQTVTCIWHPLSQFLPKELVLLKGKTKKRFSASLNLNVNDKLALHI